MVNDKDAKRMMNRAKENGTKSTYLDQNWRTIEVTNVEDVNCVTDLKCIMVIVHNRHALYIHLTTLAAREFKKMPKTIDECRNEEFRYVAYRAVTTVLRGPMKIGERKLLPNCIVGMIRTIYPDKNG